MVNSTVTMVMIVMIMITITTINDTDRSSLDFLLIKQLMTSSGKCHILNPQN